MVIVFPASREFFIENKEAAAAATAEAAAEGVGPAPRRLSRDRSATLSAAGLLPTPSAAAAAAAAVSLAQGVLFRVLSWTASTSDEKPNGALHNDAMPLCWPGI